MKHELSIIGKKGRYRSPYGKAMQDIEIADVIFDRNWRGLQILSTNKVFYPINSIQIL